MTTDDPGLTPPPSAASITGAAQPAETAAELTSEQLFAGQREVRIRHAGEIYRLRLTRNGKLILQK